MSSTSDSLYLATRVLDHVAGGTLFYPGCGADWAVPVALFAPLVSDFWFVDRGYFIPGHEDTREDRLDRLPAESPPLLLDHPAYVLRHRSIERPWLQPGYCSGGPHFRSDWPDLDAWRHPEASDAVRDRAAPLILTEHYQHEASGRNIRLHRCRGDTRAYFEGEPRLTHLSVFFYRGDSAGEGGSGIRWLSPKLEAAVIQRLKPGGLFVSDGSDGAMFPDRCRSAFRRGQRTRINPARDIARVVAAIKPIHTEQGMRLRCVGYAGERYGSTLVWQTPTTENSAGRRLDPARAGPRPPHPYGSAFDRDRHAHPANPMRYRADIAGSPFDEEE